MWYDIVVLVVLVYCTARGAARGLIWQLAAIAGIILCLMFAETFSAVVGPHIDLQPPLNEWVILFAAYLFFSFVPFAAARIINRGIEKVHMNEFNRHLGAIFGFIKGAVICLVLTFFVATLPSMHDAIKGSKSGRFAAIIMDRIHPVMPEKLHDSLQKYIHSLDDVDTGRPRVHDHDHEGEDPMEIAVRDAAEAEPAGDLWSSIFGGGDSHDEPVRSGSTPPPTTPISSIPGGIPTTPQYRSSIPTGTNLPGTNTPSTPTGQKSISDAFLSEVQGALGSEARRRLTETFQDLDPQKRQQLQAQVLDLLKKTSPQDIPQIQQRLEQAAADRLPGLLSSWSQSLANQPAVSNTDESQLLLEDISRLRSTFPQVQSRMQSEIRGLMKGVPESVQTAVLRDWKSDLSNSYDDPDPQTDSNTSVEMRILRQLQVAGLRLDILDQDLQDRLSSGADQGVQLR